MFDTGRTREEAKKLKHTVLRASRAKYRAEFNMVSSSSTFASASIASAESCLPHGDAAERRVLTAVAETEWHLPAPAPAAS